MTDQNLEREFRAMLAERSGDVAMSPAPYASLRKEIASAQRRRRQRISGAMVAAVVAAAGAGAFATTRHKAQSATDPAKPKAATKFEYEDGQTVFAKSGGDYTASSAALGGYVGYMRDDAIDFLRAHHGDAENPTPDPVAVSDGGYTVVTTFDKHLMDDAVAAADQGLWKTAGIDPVKRPATDQGVHLAFAAVDPKNGYVRAFYSGVDGVEDYERNPVEDALHTPAQIGELMFPITLATGLQTGKFTLGSRFPATNSRVLYWPSGAVDEHDRLTYADSSGRVQNWPPPGDDEPAHVSGLVPLSQGLDISSSAVFADLELEPSVTPKAVLDMAHSLGLSGDDMIPAPSLTLGPTAQTPLTMASAYGAFADEGLAHAPVTVAEVRDASGKVVWHAASDGTPVLPRGVAADVAGALRGTVANDDGTADTNSALRTVPDAAGKTATADFDHSAWFAGFDGRFSVAVTMFRYGTQPPEVPHPSPTASQDEGTSGLPRTPSMLASLAGLGGHGRVTGAGYPGSVWAAFLKMAGRPAGS